MAIEAALFELLTEDAGVAGLVGSRVYPVVLPQNPTLPAVVYQELRTAALSATGGDTGRRESRMQVSYWAESYAGVKAGKAALVALLSGYRGGIFERVGVEAMQDDVDVETGWRRQIVEILALWVE